MKYIKLNEDEIERRVKETIEVIKMGGIIIAPTDTVYGLISDALNEKAVEKIYEIKKRKKSNPCSILVSNKDMLKKVVRKVSFEEEKIIDKFFPGAITLIFEKNEQIPDIVTSGLNTVGIRMPNDKFLLKVIELLGSPIVATSLNLAGEETKTNLDNISKEILNNVDYVIDNGNTKIGVASTVAKIDGKKVEILREGTITKNMIQEVLEEEI